MFYVLAQFLGGLAGVLLVATVLDGPLSHPAVNFAATVPGVYGPAAAFGAEAAIAFLMMLISDQVRTKDPRPGERHLLTATALIARDLQSTGQVC